MDTGSDSNITPEKQLLKLIEDPDAESISKAKGQYKAKSVFSFEFLKGLNPFSSKRTESSLGGKSTLLLDIRGINWILKICILGMAAYLATYVVMSTQELKVTPQLFNTMIPRAVRDIKVKEVKPDIETQSFYTDKVEIRNILLPYEEAEPEEEVAVDTEVAKKKPIAPAAAEFLSGLRVVGIAGSEEPDVIIENTKISRTFFLKDGGEFCGATILEILPDKVIIEYEGQELELR